MASAATFAPPSSPSSSPTSSAPSPAQHVAHQTKRSCIGKQIEWLIKCEKASTAAKVGVYILAFFVTLVLCASFVLIPLFVAYYKEYEAQSADAKALSQMHKLQGTFRSAKNEWKGQKTEFKREYLALVSKYKVKKNELELSNGKVQIHFSNLMSAQKLVRRNDRLIAGLHKKCGILATENTTLQSSIAQLELGKCKHGRR